MSSRPHAAAAANSGDAALARDIVTLHKALSLEPSHHRRSLPLPSSDHHPKLKPSSSRKLAPTSSAPSTTSSSSSSSSFWRKSITAISHLGRRRLDCAFSLHVHSIDGLPPALDGTTICVHFRRNSSASAAAAASTRPAAASRGAAEFGETLTQRSPVYYSRSGGGGGGQRTAKYEPRVFTVAARTGVASLDLGKHDVDLTRLLPLSADDLEEGDEGGFGKWSTSFRLSGPARGARLNVTFGCALVTHAGEQRKVGEGLAVTYGRMERREPMLTPVPLRSRDGARTVEDVKVLHEVFPSSRSKKALDLEPEKCSASGDPKLEVIMDELKDHVVPEGVGGDDQESPQSKHCTSVEMKKGDLGHSESACGGEEYNVVEQGIETAPQDQVEAKLGTVGDAIAQEEKLGGKPYEQEEVKPMAVVDHLVQEELVGVKLDEEQEVKPLAVNCVISQGEDVEVKPADLAGDTSSSGDELQEAGLFVSDKDMEDLETVFHSLSILEPEDVESPCKEDRLSRRLSYVDTKAGYKSASMKSKSRSMDASSVSVASEFLDMLGIGHSPFGLTSDSDTESPRERLWRQFEKETLASGSGILGLDFGDGIEEPNYEDSGDDFDLSAMVREAECELQNESQPIESKSRAKLLEDAETEALMREFGLNEKSFQSSPPGIRSGFGSPIDLLPEEPLELPPLADGLGPFVQTKGGGFLRSMSPALFKNAKNNGGLVMQASSPIVVPAEMGSGIMEILQGLASVGIEKLSMQAKKLMPLEDVTGKTIQQMAWEAAPALESAESYDLLGNHSIDALVGTSNAALCKGEKGRHVDLSSSRSGEIAPEYVSLEDLAPLAMDKIEALSVEGLRIQSGMSDEEAPSNISAQSIGEFSALKGEGAENSWSLGLEGTAGLQLLDVKQSGDDVDGLMGLSITLDEWMRLDSGIVDEEDQFSDRTSKILAAHHAKSMELVGERRNADKKSKRSGRRWGLLGNNFTVALMVQLRDPLRNYEPVGTPMLALIQVERVFVPPKPKIYNTVSETGNSEQDEEPETEHVADKVLVKEEKIEEENSVPQFKITEVHVAGFKSEPEKKKLWGNQTQEQSGSRWLLAAGMGKGNKHPCMKSKAVKSTKEMGSVQPGDTLWSISSRVHGTGSRWKDLAAVKTHSRNPNIILPNEKGRLR